MNENNENNQKDTEKSKQKTFNPISEAYDFFMKPRYGHLLLAGATILGMELGYTGNNVQRMILKKEKARIAMQKERDLERKSNINVYFKDGRITTLTNKEGTVDSVGTHSLTEIVGNHSLVKILGPVENYIAISYGNKVELTYHNLQDNIENKFHVGQRLRPKTFIGYQGEPKLDMDRIGTSISTREKETGARCEPKKYLSFKLDSNQNIESALYELRTINW